METIAIASGKGGTGKSCMAAYIGASLAFAGKKVLLIELGDTPRSIDLILGVQENILYDFAAIVAGRCSIEKAIVRTSYHTNLYLLPGPILPVTFTPEIAWFRTFLKHFDGLFDFVVLDGVDFHALPPALVDKIILVITPESLAIRTTAMYSRALYDAGAEHVRLLINNVSPQLMPMYGARDFDDVIDTIGAQLLGVVPASPMIQLCSNNAQKLEDAILPVQVFRNIASRLLGEHPTLLLK